MAFDWGSAFTAFAPYVDKASSNYVATMQDERKRKEEETLRKLQEQLYGINIDKGKIDLENTRSDTARTTEGFAALARAVDLKNKQDRPYDNTVPYAPAPEGPMPKPLGKTEIADKEKLWLYSDVEPVKNYLNSFKSDSGILGSSAQSDRYRIAKENPALVDNAISTINSYRGKYSDEFITSLTELAKVDPLQALNQLTATGKPTESREQTLLRTIPLEADKSSKTSYAGTTGSLAAGRDAQSNLGMSEIDPGTGKPFSNDQKKQANYAIGMERALDNISKLKSKGFNESELMNQVFAKFKQKDNVKITDIINMGRTPEQRQYLQATVEFMMPDLRGQSGAVINGGEYSTEAIRYFPITGDDPETLKQKEASRISQLAVQKAMAGGAYDFVKKREKEEIGDRIPPSTSSSGPQIGTIDEGYKFKGGDPNDPNNWEAVQ